MIRIGCLVSGGGTNLQAILDAIERDNIDARVVCVVSSKEGAYALERAKAKNIETAVMKKKDYEKPEDYDTALADYFEERNVDLVVYAGFMLILGKNFVDRFENRMINIHPALIPSFCGKGYYGLHVHEAVINSGVKITGATVHFVTAECDAGPIILQKAVEVKYDDTPEVLQKRVMEQAEWVIYPQAVKLFAEGRLKVEGNRVKITE